MATNISVVIAALLFSAFFSATEIAFVSANRLHLAIQRRRGSRSAEYLSRMIDRPGYFIGMTLIGNTAALVIYGVFMARLLDPVIAEYLVDWGGTMAANADSESLVRMVLQTAISTLIVLATAEFLPKSLALINPERMLGLFTYPVYGLYVATFPLVWAVVSLTRLLIVKVFRVPYSEERPAFGLTDLNDYLQNTVETKETPGSSVDTKIFDNALKFKTVKVRDCMVPRPEIQAIEVSAGIEGLREAFTRTGHSKILVYRESIDNIIGYAHMLSLYRRPESLEQALSKIRIVPETMPVHELMVSFLQERKSIALVVDEFGGTSGIVTTEDIIEEIFGDIEDEHDEDDLETRQIDDDNYLLSARNEIDDLNEQFGLGLPEGDYDTLAGLILSVHEDIPAIGDEIEIPGYRATVKSMNDAKIDKVHLRRDATLGV